MVSFDAYPGHKTVSDLYHRLWGNGQNTPGMPARHRWRCQGEGLLCFPKPLDAFSHMIHEEVRCCDGGRFGPVKQ